MPDNLLLQLRSYASETNKSLKDILIEAAEQYLERGRPKVRRPPPVIGSASAATIGSIRKELVDEAMSG